MNDDLADDINKLETLCAALGVKSSDEPATLDEVAAFERSAVVDLGGDIRTFLCTARPGLLLTDQGDGVYQYHGLKRMRNSWFDSKATPRFGQLAGQETVISGTNRLGVISLASDPRGNELLWVADEKRLRKRYSGDSAIVAGGPVAKAQTLAWNHETDEYVVVSRSVRELVAQCTQSLEQRLQKWRARAK